MDAWWSRARVAVAPNKLNSAESGSPVSPAFPPTVLALLYTNTASLLIWRVLVSTPLSDPLLNWLGAVWESWGGRHGGQRDPVHFQPRM